MYRFRIVHLLAFSHLISFAKNFGTIYRIVEQIDTNVCKTIFFVYIPNYKMYCVYSFFIAVSCHLASPTHTHVMPPRWRTSQHKPSHYRTIQHVSTHTCEYAIIERCLTRANPYVWTNALHTCIPMLCVQSQCIPPRHLNTPYTIEGTCTTHTHLLRHVQMDYD